MDRYLVKYIQDTAEYMSVLFDGTVVGTGCKPTPDGDDAVSFLVIETPDGKRYEVSAWVNDDQQDGGWMAIEESTNG